MLLLLVPVFPSDSPVLLVLALVLALEEAMMNYVEFLNFDLWF